MPILFFLLFCASSLFAGEFPEQFVETLKKEHCHPTERILIVSVKQQTMTLHRQGKKPIIYTISTAKKGIGQQEGSFQTPLGLHRIAKKIGQKAPAYTIFKERQSKGIWHFQKKYAHEDLVLSRILWLEGLEEGYNRGHDAKGHSVDTYERYIYIHATNHEKNLGTPASHGCLRMSTTAVIDLFSRVEEGDLLWIGE